MGKNIPDSYISRHRQCYTRLEGKVIFFQWEILACKAYCLYYLVSQDHLTLRPYPCRPGKYSVVMLFLVWAGTYELQSLVIFRLFNLFRSDVICVCELGKQRSFKKKKKKKTRRTDGRIKKAKSLWAQAHIFFLCRRMLQTEWCI